MEYAAKSASNAAPTVGYITDLIDGDNDEDDCTVCMECPIETPSPGLRPTFPRVFKLTSKSIASSSGMSSDFSYVMDEVSKEAMTWRAEYCEEMPLNVLVFEVAKVMQGCTMRPGVRPLALAVLVGGVDSENRPRLFQINSAGDVTEGREFVVGESNFGPDELREAVERDKVRINEESGDTHTLPRRAELPLTCSLPQ